MNAIGLNDIDLESLKKGLADGSLVLIDVREPDEFAAGHIKGASINPLSRFDAEKLPAPAPGKKIVLYCRSGRRSVDAAERAHRAGRSDIDTHFGGGILAWVGAGLDTEKGD